MLKHLDKWVCLLSAISEVTVHVNELSTRVYTCMHIYRYIYIHIHTGKHGTCCNKTLSELTLKEDSVMLQQSITTFLKNESRIVKHS